MVRTITMQPPTAENLQTFFERLYLVPEFQRQYSWRADDQVSRLWEDLTQYVLTLKEKDPKQGRHFLGTSILYAESGTASESTIIDGQQRTITITCLFAAFRDLARLWDSSHRLKTDAGDMIWDDVKLKQKLNTEVYDRDQKALTDICNPDTYWAGGTYNQPSGKGSTNRVVRTYLFFCGALETLLLEEACATDAEKVKKLKWWFEEVRKTAYVHINHTDSLEQAYIMFDSQNSTGMDLDPSDILKHRLMLKGKDLHGNVNKVNDTWKKLRSYATEGGLKFDAKNLTYALTDYYKSRADALVNSRGFLAAWDELLKDILNKPTRADQVSSFDNLLEELESFAQGWSAWFFKNSHSKDYCDLVDMRVAHQYSGMVGAASTGAYTPTGKQRRALLSAMEFVHVHQKLGGSMDSNALKKLHQGWMTKMYNASHDGLFDDALKAIKKEAEALKGKSVGEMQTRFQWRDLSTAEARYLLRKCEYYLSGKYHTAADDLEVEHIAPKTHETAAGWTHLKWSDDTTMLNRLGNLTLLLKSDNIKVSNKPWADKKKAYTSKSSLKLNAMSQLTTPSNWTDSNIKNRGKALAKVLYDNVEVVL